MATERAAGSRRRRLRTPQPSCKCDLGDGVFRPSPEAIGKGFSKSIALFPVSATPSAATARDMADALVARCEPASPALQPGRHGGAARCRFVGGARPLR